MLGRSEPEVSVILRILTLPQGLLTRAMAAEIPPSRGVLLELARMAESPERDAMMARAAAGRLTVQAIRAVRNVDVRHLREKRLIPPRHRPVTLAAIAHLDHGLREESRERRPLAPPMREALGRLRLILEERLSLGGP